MNAYEGIVLDLASACSSRICRRVVRQLQLNRDTQWDDSTLISVWEEVCVQVQYDHSVLWWAYDSLVHSYIESAVSDLAMHELRALWLQTPDGIDWVCDEEGEQGQADPGIDHVVDYIADDLYSRAADWSNDRIRRYLARSD